MLQRISILTQVFLAFAVSFGVAAFAPTAAEAQNEFLRGDVNVDGVLSMSDVLMLRRWLFIGATPPPCEDSADFFDTGFINLTDAIGTLNYLYLGGPPPLSPFPGVGPDPSEDELTCADYTVSPPATTNDTVRVGNVSGSPGDAIRIPIYVTPEKDIEAFQLILAYDPTLFEPDPLSPRESTSAFADTVYEGHFDENRAPGFVYTSTEIEPNTVVFGFIPSFVDSDWDLLAENGEQLVVHINGVIAADAPTDTEVALELTNGEGGDGVGPDNLVNELTHLGDARFVSVMPQLVDGMLQIVAPSEALFIRGDSNANSQLELADAIVTLSYLFLGATPPACFDAADTDDDGALALNDPVLLLNFLFLGGETIAAPFPAPGADPTSDALGCAGL